MDGNEKSDRKQDANSRLEPNVLATISYVLPGVLGLVMYLWEKDNRFVRFHAFQSILFGLVWFGASSMAASLQVFLIGFVLAPFIQFFGAAVWFLLMWKAYSNEEFRLPYLGDIAHRQVNK